MKEWLKAESSEDVRRFYDGKYAEHGVEALASDDWERHIAVLEAYTGPLERPKALLDAGCGTGRFLQAVFSRLACAGFDISSLAVDFAKLRLGDRAVIWRADIMEKVSTVFREEFDIVTCFGAIEHAMDPRAALRNLLDVTKSGGIVFITVPLEFEDCLSYIEGERNQITNERFMTGREWVGYFSEVQMPETNFTIGSDYGLVFQKGKS